jgi:hypothetical protein
MKAKDIFIIVAIPILIVLNGLDFWGTLLIMVTALIFAVVLASYDIWRERKDQRVAVEEISRQD